MLFVPLSSGRFLIASASLALLCLPPSRAVAAPFISEFLASNSAGIVDEDNAHSDWIEIYNPDQTNVSLQNWSLTDNAALPHKWNFPAVTMGPNQFLLVWASGKNRTVVGNPLHTNFSLSAGGEYLALVKPDGTVAQDFGTQYPAQDTDRSFGISFSGTQLVTPGDAGKLMIPSNGALGSTWTNNGFDASAWTSVNTGVGFGVLQPGMTVRVVKRNTSYGAMGSLTDVDTLLAQPTGSPQITQEYTQITSTFNLVGEGAAGHYTGDTPVTLTDPNYYVGVATGYLLVTTPGIYTFGINSDDGGRVRIDGADVMVDNTLHGPADHFGQVNLTAGLHSFQALFFEQGGGDEGEWFVARGSYAAWDSTNFMLVGNSASLGLSALTPPLGVVGGGNLVQTNIETAMRNINATAYLRQTFNVSNPANFASLNLRMHYADGFVAYLNGTEVARRNAPSSLSYNSAATATRPPADVTQVETIPFTAPPGLLVTGTNVLAIQGLNNSASDSAFLLRPDLSGGGFNFAEPAYFNTPTPNTGNAAPSSYGKVADTNFSLKRGIYPNATTPTLPFPVTITCTTPGATIRYTLDGSTPSATNGIVYSGPISISSTTVLRAVATKPNWDSTNVDTNTYLVLDDVLTQSANGLPPAGWPTGPINAQVIDYGMDPDIVNSTDPNIGGAAQVKSALMALPSVCLTTDLPNLYDAATGIYTHPSGRGLGWERQASLELINDPQGGFQVPCGIRIRGGYSRSTDNPKHGWHIYFRSEYGKSKLNYPLFGYDGTSEFDQFDLRTAENYSWSFGGDSRNTFLREEFSRTTQLAMGQPASHLRYYHLYINGQYFGIYNTDERPEASYMASYFGGTKDDYDVVKCEQDSGYVIGFTDGSLAAWQSLWTKARAHAAETDATARRAKYYEMQGLQADGVTRYNDPVNHPVLLDVDNLIDYLLLTFWTGNLDGATSAFLSNTRANNWFGARRIGGDKGFIYFAHDFEHTLFSTTEDRTGPFIDPSNADFNYSNPLYLHQDLTSSPEYRARWTERIQKHLFNGGALSLEKNTARINALAAQLDTAIYAESARWGDAKVATPLNRQNWKNERDYLLNSYLPVRTASVLAQLRADNLYPALDSVTANPLPGYLAAGAPITLTSTSPIYYTTNGVDPQNTNGSLNAAATLFATPTTTTDTLIADGSTAAGATWKYNDTNTDLGSSDIVVGNAGYTAANWKHPNYDDSNPANWKTGDAELGFGDSPRTTVLSGTSTARIPVVYFRKKFTVTNPSQYSALNIDIKRDDGAIIYINGQEVGRSSIATGSLGFVYAGTTVGGTDEETFFPVVDARLNPSVLVNGVNTICVQMHQTNATSSDMSFDLRLTATKTTYPNPITFTGSGAKRILARTYNGTSWGALVDLSYLLETEAAGVNNLTISEIMYHPADPTAGEVSAGFTDGDQFEFLEIQNIGTKTVELSNVRLVDGVQFNFSASTVSKLLAPGQRILVVSDVAAFTFRYGAGLPVAGAYVGNLSNGGETLTLIDAASGIMKSFSYGGVTWPPQADGAGYSLVLKNPSTNPNPGVVTNWRTSAMPGGNPNGTDVVGYAAWKSSYTVIADHADTDHDGLDSVLEYALGTSPQQPSTEALPVAGTTNISGADYASFTFQRRLGADDCQCIPEISTALGSWDPAGVVITNRFATGDGKEQIECRTVQPTSNTLRVFFRVRAVVQ